MISTICDSAPTNILKMMIGKYILRLLHSSTRHSFILQRHIHCNNALLKIKKGFYFRIYTLYIIDN